MPRYTDGRPEEEFLTRAHERQARADNGDLDDDDPTVDIIIDDDDLDRGLAPPERDDRVPPWWSVRRSSVAPARGLVMAVLLVFALSLVLIGMWVLTTGGLPAYDDLQPSPQALPGSEDVAEPGGGNEF